MFVNSWLININPESLIAKKYILSLYTIKFYKPYLKEVGFEPT